MSYKANTRNEEEEWMDDPNIDPIVLKAAVDDINFINHWLQGFKFMRDALNQILAQYPKGKIRIVDVGCGDGAMLRYLNQELQDPRLHFLGLDISKTSIKEAQKKSENEERLEFRESDIHLLNKEELNCDIMISSLTMHHFNEDQIIAFLKKFKSLANKAIVINDLHRHRLAYTIFKYLSPIFITHQISKHDGLISIASGFKRADFKRYATAINCSNDRLIWKWSFRYIWIIPIDECKN